MATGRHNLTLERGVTRRISVVVETPDPENPTGPRVKPNLTGYTARFQAKQTGRSSTYLLDLTTENGGIVIDGPAARLTVTIRASDLRRISSPSGIYVLDLMGPTGDDVRLLRGAIAFTPDEFA